MPTPIYENQNDLGCYPRCLSQNTDKSIDGHINDANRAEDRMRWLL